MVCIRSEALIFDQWLKITEPVRKLKKLFIKFPLDGSLVDLFSGTPFLPFSVFFKAGMVHFDGKTSCIPNWFDPFLLACHS